MIQRISKEKHQDQNMFVNTYFVMDIGSRSAQNNLNKIAASYFPWVQWPAAIRHSGAWLGVQGVFNWSKYVVKFSAYSSIARIAQPPAPPVTTTDKTDRARGEIRAE